MTRKARVQGFISCNSEQAWCLLGNVRCLLETVFVFAVSLQKVARLSIGIQCLAFAFFSSLLLLYEITSLVFGFNLSHTGRTPAQQPIYQGSMPESFAAIPCKNIHV